MTKHLALLNNQTKPGLFERNESVYSMSSLLIFRFLLENQIDNLGAKLEWSGRIARCSLARIYWNLY